MNAYAGVRRREKELKLSESLYHGATTSQESKFLVAALSYRSLPLGIRQRRRTICPNGEARENTDNLVLAGFGDQPQNLRHPE